MRPRATCDAKILIVGGNYSSRGLLTQLASAHSRQRVNASRDNVAQASQRYLRRTLFSSTWRGKRYIE